MLYYLFFGICWLIFSTNNAIQLIELRNAHFPQALSNAQLNYLTQLSNTTHLNAVLDNICVPRVVGTAGHDNVHNYIVSHLTDIGWHVEIDNFKEKTPIFGTLEFRNIIATLNPEAERYLVLACHYDSKYFKEFDFIAASDSAVPCAMILNLAYVMSEELAGKRDDLDLKLIFFDGEEAFHTWGPKDSIYGARHLATVYEAQQELTKSGHQVSHLDRIDLLMLLDLLGPKDPNFYSYFADTNKWYLKLVEAEQRLKKLGHVRRPGNYFMDYLAPVQIEDDHVPFLRRGVPILHLIPTPFPDFWHTAKDNRDIVDVMTTENLNKILRIFVAEYLHLSVTS